MIDQPAGDDDSDFRSNSQADVPSPFGRPQPNSYAGVTSPNPRIQQTLNRAAAQEDLDNSSLYSQAKTAAKQNYLTQRNAQRDQNEQTQAALEQAGRQSRLDPLRNVIPAQTDEQWAAQLHGEDLDSESKSLSDQAKVNATQMATIPAVNPKDLQKQGDAVRQALVTKLQPTADLKQGGIMGTGLMAEPTDEAKAAQANIASINTPGPDGQLPPLQDSHLEMLRQSGDPDAAALADKYAQSQAATQQRADLAKQTALLHNQAAIAKQRKDDPQTWLQNQQLENATLPSGQLQAKIQSQDQDWQTRKAQYDQQSAEIGQGDAQFEAQKQQVIGANQQAMAQGTPGANLVQGPDGQMWTRDHLAQYQDVTAQHQQYQLQTMRQRGLLAAQNIRLTQDGAVLDHAEKVLSIRQSVADQQHADPAAAPVPVDVPEKDEGPIMAGIHAAARAFPSLAAGGEAAVMAEPVIAPIAAATGPFMPVTHAVLSMATAIAATLGVRKFQDKAIDAIAPESFMGTKTAEKEQKQHDVSTLMGDLFAGGLPSLKNLGNAGSVVKSILTGEGKEGIRSAWTAMAKNGVKDFVDSAGSKAEQDERILNLAKIQSTLNVAVGSGTFAGQAIAEGKSPGDVAKEAALGALFTGKSPLHLASDKLRGKTLQATPQTPEQEAATELAPHMAEADAYDAAQARKPELEKAVAPHEDITKAEQALADAKGAHEAHVATGEPFGQDKTTELAGNVDAATKAVQQAKELHPDTPEQQAARTELDQINATPKPDQSVFDRRDEAQRAQALAMIAKGRLADVPDATLAKMDVARTDEGQLVPLSPNHPFATTPTGDIDHINGQPIIKQDAINQMAQFPKTQALVRPEAEARKQLTGENAPKASKVQPSIKPTGFKLAAHQHVARELPADLQAHGHTVVQALAPHIDDIYRRFPGGVTLLKHGTGAQADARSGFSYNPHTESLNLDLHAIAKEGLHGADLQNRIKSTLDEELRHRGQYEIHRKPGMSNQDVIAAAHAWHGKNFADLAATPEGRELLNGSLRAYHGSQENDLASNLKKAIAGAKAAGNTKAVENLQKRLDGIGPRTTVDTLPEDQRVNASIELMRQLSQGEHTDLVTEAAAVNPGIWHTIKSWLQQFHGWLNQQIPKLHAAGQTDLAKKLAKNRDDIQAWIKNVDHRVEEAMPQSPAKPAVSVQPDLTPAAVTAPESPTFERKGRQTTRDAVIQSEEFMTHPEVEHDAISRLSEVARGGIRPPEGQELGGEWDWYKQVIDGAKKDPEVAKEKSLLDRWVFKNGARTSLDEASGSLDMPHLGEELHQAFERRLQIANDIQKAGSDFDSHAQQQVHDLENATDPFAAALATEHAPKYIAAPKAEDKITSLKWRDDQDPIYGAWMDRSGNLRAAPAGHEAEIPHPEGAQAISSEESRKRTAQGWVKVRADGDPNHYYADTPKGDFSEAQKKAIRSLSENDGVDISNENGHPLANRSALFAPTAIQVKDDMRGQSAWMDREAKARGFAGPDELAAKKPADFAKLSEQWRAYHGRDSEGNYVQNAQIRSIDRALYGDTKATPDDARRDPKDRLADAQRFFGEVRGPTEGSARFPRSAGERRDRALQGIDEKRQLITWARKSGNIIDKLPKALQHAVDIDDGGQEHNVAYVGDRVLKITRGDGTSMGMIPVLDGKSWTLSTGNARSYLDQIANSNKLLGDVTTFHGVYQDKAGNIGVVTSQPFIGGGLPDEPFIHQSFENSGFKKIDRSTFYRESDNATITDSHLENGRRIGDTFLPFDVGVSHPSAELRQAMLDDAARMTEPLHAPAHIASDPEESRARDASQIAYRRERYAGTPHAQAAEFGAQEARSITEPQRQELDRAQSSHDAEAADVHDQAYQSALDDGMNHAKALAHADNEAENYKLDREAEAQDQQRAATADRLETAADALEGAGKSHNVGHLRDRAEELRKPMAPAARSRFWKGGQGKVKPEMGMTVHAAQHITPADDTAYADAVKNDPAKAREMLDQTAKAAGAYRLPQADDNIAARKIVPLNNSDDSKWQSIRDHYKKAGTFTGRPILVYTDGVQIHGLTGSHRIRAARDLGLKVPVIEIHAEDIDDALVFLKEDGVDDLPDSAQAFQSERTKEQFATLNSLVDHGHHEFLDARNLLLAELRSDELEDVEKRNFPQSAFVLNNQIKSADLDTGTPLSQRFNEGSNDIRHAPKVITDLRDQAKQIKDLATEQPLFTDARSAVTKWTDTMQRPSLEGKDLTEAEAKAHEQSANATLKADLLKGKARDGQPLLAPSSKATVQRPAGVPALAGYSVHPEVANSVNAIYGTSALRDWTASRSDNVMALLAKKGVKLLEAGNSFSKLGMLGFSPFHIIQEGTHAVGHHINPFGKIERFDSSNPWHTDATRHGLMLGHDSVSANEFSEGLKSGGWVDKIPLIGPLGKKVSDFTFKTYIPSLKLKTYRSIVERNLKRFQPEIIAGKMTPADIKYLSAKQVNDAYGHLNYKDIGASPTVQHILSLGMLAPDFFFARARFSADAAKGLFNKSGREQAAAMATLGVVMYAGARVMNALANDGDMKMDHPFSVVHGNREYTMRSVPEDIYRAIMEPGKFLLNRASPMVHLGMELAQGKDYAGRTQTAGQALVGAAKNLVPMTFRPGMKMGYEQLPKAAQDVPGMKDFMSDTSVLGPLESMYGSVGVQTKAYSPVNDAGDLARKYAASIGKNDDGVYPVSRFSPLKDALLGNDIPRAKAELAKLGPVDPKALHSSIFHNLTQSVTDEPGFRASLDAKGRDTVAAAERARQAMWTRYLSLGAGGGNLKGYTPNRLAVARHPGQGLIAGVKAMAR